MQITSKQLVSFSISGFIISLLVHIMAIFNIYIVSNISVGALSIGMLAVWLFSSKLVKEYTDGHENPWKKVYAETPDWLRYTFIFIVAYAIFNTVINLQVQSAGGYFDYQVAPAKVRFISGFWLILYGLGFIVGVSGAKE